MAERNTPTASRSTTPALYPITLVLVNSLSAGFIRMKDTVNMSYESGLKNPGMTPGLLIMLLSFR